MTSLFPHTAYAEDQPNGHAILYLHVMRASAMSFSFISFFRFPVSLLNARYRKLPIDMRAITARTLQSSGHALVIGSVAGALMTWGRMRGKEEIEYQDRAWRILENKGEGKTDWAVMGGAGAGAIAGLLAARRGVIPVSVGSAVLGGMGAGASIGVPFMIGSFAAGRKPS
ncbi:hypothetical protein BKA63DRAFT_514030 [Paraphoma chrysanthemicola]|nr:hypothetical protein BKA63DRAFT_514030 [Paraphoma chrysanthemicola]